MERLTKRDKNGKAIPAKTSTSYYVGTIYEVDKVLEQERLERLCEYEDKLESGQLVELPLKKQDYLYHIFKQKSKYGVVVWRKRKISWWTYVFNIIIYGDDGLYFQTLAQAEARLKELQEANNK